jgi:hypothetical protein
MTYYKGGWIRRKLPIAALLGGLGLRVARFFSLSDGFVDFGVASGAGDFFEKFKTFFFGWCFDAYAAISADVYSVFSLTIVV